MLNDNLVNLDIVRLEALKIDRKTFSCNIKALEDYFHQNVSQDVKKGLATCFVLIDNKKSQIIGYYTLSALSILVSDIPQENLKKNIPYPNIPAVLVGRLAVDDHFQKQSYGKFLLVDAIYKIKNSNIGTALLIVDAKDDNAVKFYEKFGFIAFNDIKEGGRKLFYPLSKIIK